LELAARQWSPRLRPAWNSIFRAFTSTPGIIAIGIEIIAGRRATATVGAMTMTTTGMDITTDIEGGINPAVTG
jgi:hypothetical protein